jgi:hypothetical protein
VPQISSGQCPDRATGTAPELRRLLHHLYNVQVMNIATDNVGGGNISVSSSSTSFCALDALSPVGT